VIVPEASITPAGSSAAAQDSDFGVDPDNIENRIEAVELSK